MTSFDEKKLMETKYTFDSPVQCGQCQVAVEEFMEIVRNNPAYLDDKEHLLTKFCELVDQDKVWPLAMMVVPEFHLPTTYDISNDSVMNIILAKLKHGRPQPRSDDINSVPEKGLVKRRLSQCIDYVLNHGQDNLTEEQLQQANEMTAQGILF